MKKVIVVIAIFLLATTSFYISHLSRTNNAGTIEIMLVNQLDETILQENVSFNKNDTLLDVLTRNYTIKCANALYSKTVSCDEVTLNNYVVLEFESVKTNWKDTYIAIYVNGEYSTKGLAHIDLENNMSLRFEFRKVDD
ncbi:MAG: DUF4430 domain-containing protein [Candidatus Izimaplasma sp.]|nr:DUF4430 domain-containing protein [Candidatus Izimaplasma bacterium]